VFGVSPCVWCFTLCVWCFTEVQKVAISGSLRKRHDGVRAVSSSSGISTFRKAIGTCMITKASKSLFPHLHYTMDLSDVNDRAVQEHMLHPAANYGTASILEHLLDTTQSNHQYSERLVILLHAEYWCSILLNGIPEEVMIRMNLCPSPIKVMEGVAYPHSLMQTVAAVHWRPWLEARARCSIHVWIAEGHLGKHHP
jgi:hypothetical protein